jgi:D-alanine-D-alanine ligase
MRSEIVTTPNTDLRETGFGSLKSCSSVLDSIEKMGYPVRLSLCETRKDLEDIVERAPDLVVLGVKYLSVDNGDDIWLSAFFAENEINFSGSIREVLKFDSDKVLAKSHLREDGIDTANFFTALPGQFKSESELPFRYPLFLKPLDAANGNGVDDSSLVSNFEEFEKKITSLYDRFRVPILVEEYLNGREFTVAVIKGEDGNLIVSPIEIVPPESSNGMRILGEKTKKEDSEELKRAEVSDLVTRVKRLAVDSFVSLGIRDFGRIDIKTDQDGKCFFMEANLVPGMTSGSSYFPRACEIEHRMSYDEVVRIIVAEGVSRSLPAAVPVSISLRVAPGSVAVPGGVLTDGVKDLEVAE